MLITWLVILTTIYYNRRMKKIKNDNRDLILNVSQELFYENGLNNTSYDIIANQCGISKPLISYYFESKAHLAGKIFGKYSLQMADYFTEKVYQTTSDYNTIDILAAFTIAQIRYYQNDCKASRFYIEFFDSSFYDVTEGVEDFYKMANRQLGTNIPKEHLHMLYIASNYAARGLIYHFLIKDIKCSQEDFEICIIQTGYSLFGLTDKQMRQIYSNAQQILNEIELEFLPNFKFK